MNFTLSGEGNGGHAAKPVPHDAARSAVSRGAHPTTPVRPEEASSKRHEVPSRRALSREVAHPTTPVRPEEAS